MFNSNILPLPLRLSSTVIYIAAAIVGGSLSLFCVLTLVAIAFSYWKHITKASTTTGPFFEDVNEYIHQNVNPIHEQLLFTQKNRNIYS